MNLSRQPNEAENAQDLELKKQKKAAEKLRRALPTKRTLNLIVPVSRQNKLSTVIPTAIIVAICVALFTKFAVLDRLEKVNQKEREVAQLQGQVDQLNNTLKDYDEVREKYYRYTTYFMTESEIAVIDRIELLDLLFDTAGKNVTINSIAVQYNNLSLAITAPDLKTVGDFVDALNESPKVVSAVVGNATKSTSTGETAVRATITMVVTSEEPEEEKK